MIKKKELVCIVCPTGCNLTITFDDETQKILEVSGNNCPNGIKFATNEITNPMRTLTTTVKVKGGYFCLAGVRSNQPIPKRLMKEAVKAISKIELSAPVHIGQVVVKDILGTGVDVLISKQVDTQ